MKQKVYIETSEQTSIKREEEEKKAIRFFFYLKSMTRKLIYMTSSLVCATLDAVTCSFILESFNKTCCSCKLLFKFHHYAVAL